MASLQFDTIPMNAKQWIRAEELLAQLLDERARVAAQRPECKRAYDAEASDERAAQELRVQRLVLEEWNRLVPPHAPLPHRAVESLLSCLLRVPDEALQEMLVHAMVAARTVACDGKRIAVTGSGERAAQQTTNLPAQTDVQEWIVTALADPRADRARELLAMAAARFFPRELAQRVLSSILSACPGPAAPSFHSSDADEELQAIVSARAQRNGAHGTPRL